MGGQATFGRGVPAYRVVKQRLIQALAAGIYPAGSSLPSEKELADEHGVSIGTLRKAVDSLVSEGIVVRQQGKGTFVSQHDDDRLLYYFFHIAPLGQQKIQPTSELLLFQRAKAIEEVAHKLDLGPSKQIVKIWNLLRIDAKPIILDEIALDAENFRGLTPRLFEKRPGSIYQLYESDYGQTVARVSERLRACSASEWHSKYLGIQVGHPLLQIRRIAFGFQDNPIEWRVSYVNTSEHEYFSELNAHGSF